jgi:hypothetical protein
VRVAGEVAELVHEDGAELRPVPVLAGVERDRAQRVVRRIAVVAELVRPRRNGVLVGGELGPADVDVAAARVGSPMLDGDLTGSAEGRPVGWPALGRALRRGGMCRRGRKRECEVRK